MERRISAPLSEEVCKSLNAGDNVLLSGIIYTGRDAAHKRMIETLQSGGELPFDIENQIIYYVGPCPAKPGEIIGSCGPTTSGRVDKFTPALLKKGLKGMIGKGERSPEVVEAVKKHSAVYMGAALMAKCVVKQEVIAYDDLGTEAIHKLTVKDMPLTVIIDTKGNNLYKTGKEKYKSL